MTRLHTGPPVNVFDSLSSLPLCHSQFKCTCCTDMALFLTSLISSHLNLSASSLSPSLDSSLPLFHLFVNLLSHSSSVFLSYFSSSFCFFILIPVSFSFFLLFFKFSFFSFSFSYLSIYYHRSSIIFLLSFPFPLQSVFVAGPFLFCISSLYFYIPISTHFLLYDHCSLHFPIPSWHKVHDSGQHLHL